MTDQATPEVTEKATSKSGWKKAALHYPLLPSGERVGIRIPDLPAMIEAGTIPQHLLDAALGAAKQQANPDEVHVPTKEEIVQQKEFADLLVLTTVVEPKIDVSDLPDIPTEDKEMLVALATRARDLDAEGEHIAGLTKSEKFRRFRELGEFSPSLASY
jgi:hypothetical protein